MNLSYELAKKLKDAGFKQDGDSPLAYIPLTEDRYGVPMNVGSLMKKQARKCHKCKV